MADDTIGHWIAFGGNGELAGRYVTAIHGAAIPKNAVGVDEELFNQTIAETDGAWKLNPDNSITKHQFVVSLDDAKAGKLAAINAAFVSEQLKGFAVSKGFKMDVPMESLQKLKMAYDFAVLMGEATMPVVDYDNVVHLNMPLADVEQAIKEVGAHYRSLYMTKQQLRGQVNAAATAEAVAAVVWPP